MTNDKKQYDQRIQDLLKTVYDDCYNEDEDARYRQLVDWRQLKLLWEGFTNIWYSTTAHDWRVWDQLQASDPNNSDQSYYDKPVNVLRAYLETIIAALSVTIPPVKCFPADADNPSDLETAKAGDKVAQLLFRHNEVGMLWLHALFIYATEGMFAAYHYPESSEEYGTYKEDKYETVEQNIQVKTCPACGFTEEEEIEALPEIAAPPETIAPEMPPEMAMMEQEAADICPNCGEAVVPTVENKTETFERLVKTITHPKTRVCIEVYGGLNVKVPNYARSQKTCPYLIYSYETDYTDAIEKFEELDSEDLKNNLTTRGGIGSYNEYAQWARLSPQYQGEFPKNVVTVNHAWIRPSRFNCLGDENDVKLLKKEFPEGVKVTFVDDIYAEACPEKLDDRWTIGENPMSDFIHFEPVGRGLVSVQDITNDIISLVLQTMEHGISQTFADPSVLNFQAYGETEVSPGGVFPATPRGGKSLGDAFHDLKTATLSSEVLPFFQSVQSVGQLSVGALPSLFGGALTEGSETASEYSMSRAQALQRLQNSWKMTTSWWKRVFTKAIPMYIENLKEDEKDVQRNRDGGFVNVLIRKAELMGKIGKVELDTGENLPMTWAQKRDVIKELMVNPNPMIGAMLNAPENLPLIHEALGLVDFVVPGEDDVIKQYDEIEELLNSEPVPNPDFVPGQPLSSELLPSVDIDPIFDNHQVEFDIVRRWAVGESGRLAKVENPAGYQNVLLHGKLHFIQMNMMMMQQQQQQAAQDGSQDGGNPEDPNSQTNDAPIEGEGDVDTV